ncbi:hypothetical protein [Stutzerimonas nitrititolerans]|uniref:hypothetical protein n=1 Tax=Stutzerimonas nitrititolerans TaxID=2482751 RepID=UPI003D816997
MEVDELAPQASATYAGLAIVDVMQVRRQLGAERGAGIAGFIERGRSLTFGKRQALVTHEGDRQTMCSHQAWRAPDVDPESQAVSGAKARTAVYLTDRMRLRQFGVDLLRRSPRDAGGADGWVEVRPWPAWWR